jgi:Ala-tRNA(Pro) deacylase
MNAPVRASIHQQLLALLNRSHARYRVVEHEAVGKCEAVSKIRGTALGQGAKALVCKIKGHGVNQHVLAILAADLQADLARLAAYIGGSKASLASPAEVDALTACVFGAIPPFSFHPALRLVADPLLFARFPEIAFNAGQLDKSIILDTADYLRIARPELTAFHRRPDCPLLQRVAECRGSQSIVQMPQIASLR